MGVIHNNYANILMLKGNINDLQEGDIRYNLSGTDAFTERFENGAWKKHSSSTGSLHTDRVILDGIGVRGYFMKDIDAGEAFLNVARIGFTNYSTIFGDHRHLSILTGNATSLGVVNDLEVEEIMSSDDSGEMVDIESFMFNYTCQNTMVVSQHKTQVDRDLFWWIQITRTDTGRIVYTSADEWQFDNNPEIHGIPYYTSIMNNEYVNIEIGEEIWFIEGIEYQILMKYDRPATIKSNVAGTIPYMLVQGKLAKQAVNLTYENDVIGFNVLDTTGKRFDIDGIKTGVYSPDLAHGIEVKNDGIYLNGELFESGDFNEAQLTSADKLKSLILSNDDLIYNDGTDDLLKISAEGMFIKGSTIIAPTDMTANLSIKATSGYDAEMRFFHSGSTGGIIGYDSSADLFKIGRASSLVNAQISIDSAGEVTFGEGTLNLGEEGILDGKINFYHASSISDNAFITTNEDGDLKLEATGNGAIIQNVIDGFNGWFVITDQNANNLFTVKHTTGDTFIKGKVGIGTSIPKSLLHVSTGVTSNLGTVPANRGMAITGLGGYSRIYMEATDSAVNSKVFNIDNDAGKFSIGSLQDDGGTYVNAKLLVINAANANVGISNDTPLYTLDVAGDFRVNDGSDRIITTATSTTLHDAAGLKLHAEFGELTIEDVDDEQRLHISTVLTSLAGPGEFSHSIDIAAGHTHIDDPYMTRIKVDGVATMVKGPAEDAYYSTANIAHFWIVDGDGNRRFDVSDVATQFKAQGSTPYYLSLAGHEAKLIDSAANDRFKINGEDTRLYGPGTDAYNIDIENTHVHIKDDANRRLDINTINSILEGPGTSAYKIDIANVSAFIFDGAVSRVLANETKTSMMSANALHEFKVDNNGAYYNDGVVTADVNGVSVSSSLAVYIGSEDVDGSYRMRADSGELVFEHRVTGTWVQIGSFS